MEYLPHLPKSIKDLLKDAEINGPANIMAQDFFPNNIRAQELLKKEIRGEITNKELKELEKFELEEQKRLEKEAEGNGSEDREPGSDE